MNKEKQKSVARTARVLSDFCVWLQSELRVASCEAQSLNSIRVVSEEWCKFHQREPKRASLATSVRRCALSTL